MIVLYLLLAVAVLLFMVLVHELGHYVAGRILKFKIDEFSVGFGKAIFSHKNKRGEKISLRIFPLGGYCAFAGEDGTDENGKPTSDKDAFTNQKPWKRIIVFLAGVTFNFLTAIIFSFILLVSVGYDIYKVDNSQLKVDEYVLSYETSVLPEGYEENGGLQKGDVIFYVDGVKVDFAYSKTFQELLSNAHAKRSKWIEENTTTNEVNGETVSVEPDFSTCPEFVTFRVRRNGKMIDIQEPYLKITYLSTNSKGEVLYKKDKDGKFILDEDEKRIPETLVGYTIGGAYSQDTVQVNVIGEIDPANPDLEQETLVYNVYTVTGFTFSIYRHSFVEALGRCVPFAFGLAWVVLKSLWLLIISPKTIAQAGGPIATITTIATVTQQSMLNLLILIPLISANLAVFNILPIPALDGAHVIFTIIEWIRGKPIKREVENMIHTIGLFVLLGFVILIDILHFVL